MARLELAGLTVCGPDGRNPVLQDLDLDIADGELLTVVGTGRTTLLRALIGLADVVAGQLRIDGEPATDWAPAERDMAMVFADHAPYPHLRVRDNLALPLRMAGLPAGEVARRVGEVAAELDLTVHLDRWPSQLTGAQRQRLAIGRVLVRDRPAAYLLDEPLSTPDPAGTERLRARLAGTGCTTVWTTADLGEAGALGHRVAVLRDGRLAQVGTPAELAAQPATLAVAALAPLNVLIGTVEDGTLRLPIGTIPAPPAAAGRDSVIVGIRPADLTGTETPGTARIVLLPGEGAGPDGSTRLRHPALARAAGQDPALSADLLARVEVGDRRSVPVFVDPARVLVFDPDSGERL